MFIFYSPLNWKGIVKKTTEKILEATVSEIKKMTMSCFCHLSSKDRSRFTLQCKHKILPVKTMKAYTREQRYNSTHT
jgi:hypothetical protein